MVEWRRLRNAIIPENSIQFSSRTKRSTRTSPSNNRSVWNYNSNECRLDWLVQLLNNRWRALSSSFSNYSLNIEPEMRKKKLCVLLLSGNAHRIAFRFIFVFGFFSGFNRHTRMQTDKNEDDEFESNVCESCAMPCALMTLFVGAHDVVVSRGDEHSEIDEAEDEQSKSFNFFLFAISVDVCFFVGFCGADFVCELAADWVTRARLVSFSSLRININWIKIERDNGYGGAHGLCVAHTLNKWTLNARCDLLLFTLWMYICDAIRSHSMLTHKPRTSHTASNAIA